MDYKELHRPQFHFSARKNWINDPNGLVYQNGVWHLYFQHNPAACVWGKPFWGHAVSNDLIAWQEQDGHALSPDEHGAMFSGSAVVDHDNTAGFGEGALLAFYTAAGGYAMPKREFTQCLAFSLDGGANWIKYDGNPVLEWIEGGNRDPKVIWHAETRRWIMALYLAEDRYCLLSSPDAKTWTKIQDLTLDDDNECPDFFPLKDASGTERWVFSGAKGYYVVGRFDGKTFSAETGRQTAEFGRNGYAAQTFSNVPDGRCIQISWMAGGLYPEMPFNQQLSIPVELTLMGEGNNVVLTRWPVRELNSLRQRSIALKHETIGGDKRLTATTEAVLFDASFTVHRQDANLLYVVIRGQSLVFDWRKNEFRFEYGSASRLVPDRRQVPLPDEPTLSVRLVVDKASVEVFINGGVISASFCFLPNGYVHPFEIHSYPTEQIIEDFELHELASIWS